MIAAIKDYYIVLTAMAAGGFVTMLSIGYSPGLPAWVLVVFALASTITAIEGIGRLRNGARPAT